MLQPYLKSWSQDLGVPILSVDYSLSPEAPFPRALEECFYAYCWALKNAHLLGSFYFELFYFTISSRFTLNDSIYIDGHFYGPTQ